MRHPLRWAVTVLCVLVVALVGYSAWLLWDTSRQLSAASEDAQTAKVDVLSGDTAGAQEALRRFATHAATAADRTGSPAWSLMTRLPRFGDDARGVRTVSRVADDLATNGLDDLTAAVGDIDTVLPTSGAVDVATVESLQQPVARGHDALVQAHDELATEDPSGYVTSLKVRYRDLQATVADAADAMGIADRALQVLPAMLGADGSRNYLLVLQNNAEVRATGGLPGSVSMLTVTDGKITLAKQRSGSSFGQTPAPVLPLTGSERELYGDKLGRYFLDANLTPDFPRSAELWQAAWTQSEGDEIDGVISLDTVSLSYLLRALGPVEVDAVQLTPENVVAELLSNVYARIEDPAAQDAFFRNVASAIFTKVTSFDGSRQQLLSALRQSAHEHRLLVHDFDGENQAELTGTAVAGDLTTDDPETPQVAVTLNDGTGGKMSYYLHSKTQIQATSCADGVQTFSGKLTLESTAPADARTTLPAYVTGTSLPPRSAGMQLVAVRVFGPVGGTVDEFDDNQISFDQELVEDQGRPVRGTYMLLRPGDTKDLTWTMTSGTGQTGDATVFVTPSIDEGNDSSEVRSAC